LSGTIQISLGLYIYIYIYKELHKLTILWIAFDFVLAWALLVPIETTEKKQKE
jgi:hypothetical protein